MKTLPRRTALHLLLALGGAAALPAHASLSGEKVSLDTARAEAEAGRALLVDIREPQEHATGVSRVAKLLPMREIGARLAEIPKDAAKPVLLICNTQNRSRAVWQALRERGYTNVRYVEGGMSEWARRGLPLVPPAAR
jgi:rhodanese-related sulfurtransferase